jgi:pimeloyl-ACP methyl ester carboxylesterase
VDVFYVYPTAYSKTATGDSDICSIDNPTMLAGAKLVFQRQATAFAPSANIFAPYYRQVCIAYQLPLSDAEQDAVIAGQPGTDVTAAFEYYLQHYNHGRPFILVGHSQGSAVLSYLLSTYMKAHPDVYKRMIAAYVVGFSITPQYLEQNPHLKCATGASDTGVIISWNTEAPTVKGTNPVTRPGGIAINPITWTTGEATATATQNLGSIELNIKTGEAVLDAGGQPKRVMGLADARVDKARGVVICSAVKPADYFVGFPEGVYHPFDYPFYYFDVRANAADRIRHYLAGSH